MTTATELLRRALEEWKYWGRSVQLTTVMRDIEHFLAAEPEAEPVYQIAMAEGSTSTAWIDVAKDVFDDAGMYPEYKRRALYTRPEPEAEYDFYGVIPLTHRKTKGIIKDKGYHVTGFVLTREDGDKCVVDMSAVRWLTGKEFFEMMHPPVVSPTAEPEAEPRVWMMTRDDIENAAFEFSKEQVETYWKNRGYTIEPLYTRPSPARKPMTEEELPNMGTTEYLAFVAGVRFAEKHHGIGGDDE